MYKVTTTTEVPGIATTAPTVVRMDGKALDPYLDTVWEQAHACGNVTVLERDMGLWKFGMGDLVLTVAWEQVSPEPVDYTMAELFRQWGQEDLAREWIHQVGG